MPQVSVILPTYNRAQMLPRALRSVLSQTFGDIEVIVVDDCSDDDTAGVVRATNDHRVQYIRCAQHCGAAQARNEGIRCSRGAFIAFQDSDDEWMPEKLSKQMAVFNTSGPETGVVYTGWKALFDDGKKRSYVPEPLCSAADFHKRLLRGNCVTIHAVVRRRCFDTAGFFDPALPRLQDWDLWLRMSKQYRFACVDEPLVYVRQSSDAISMDRRLFADALEKILAKCQDELSSIRPVEARHYYVLGRELCALGQHHKGTKYLMKAAQLMPGNFVYVFFACAACITDVIIKDN